MSSFVLPIRRVIVVVLDGLRPDAIERFCLEHIARAATRGAFTRSALTVAPSLTWPALTSLTCGVSPDRHGILSDSIRLPRPKERLRPIADLLGRAGYPTSAFMGEVPPLYRPVASAIAARLGFAESRFAGRSATEVLLAAQTALRTQRRGLLFMHWADADRIGHEHGWMSEEYGHAARRLDTAFGHLLDLTGAASDPQTVLIALADHGGGGGPHPRDHEVEHPDNWTIPLLVAGGAVAGTQLRDARLLDVPPTVLWALGVEPPCCYTGRVLDEAFDDVVRVTAVA